MNTAVSVLVPKDSMAIAERVMAVIARETRVEPGKLTGNATLEELDVDSVDIVMILNGLEDEFGVYLPVEQGFTGVKNLQDFVTLVTGLVGTRAGAA
jgi:acyl carrier protein